MKREKADGRSKKHGAVSGELGARAKERRTLGKAEN